MPQLLAVAQQCLPGCAMYIGLLQPGGNVLKYVACNGASSMKGQRLYRGIGGEGHALV